jgi:hypothetical protein
MPWDARRIRNQLEQIVGFTQITCIYENVQILETDS